MVVWSEAGQLCCGAYALVTPPRCGGLPCPAWGCPACMHPSHHRRVLQLPPRVPSSSALTIPSCEFWALPGGFEDSSKHGWLRENASAGLQGDGACDLTAHLSISGSDGCAHACMHAGGGSRCSVHARHDAASDRGHALGVPASAVLSAAHTQCLRCSRAGGRAGCVHQAGCMHAGGKAGWMHGCHDARPCRGHAEASATCSASVGVCTGAFLCDNCTVTAV